MPPYSSQDQLFTFCYENWKSRYDLGALFFLIDSPSGLPQSEQGYIREIKQTEISSHKLKEHDVRKLCAEFKPPSDFWNCERVIVC